MRSRQWSGKLTSFQLFQRQISGSSLWSLKRLLYNFLFFPLTYAVLLPKTRKQTLMLKSVKFCFKIWLIWWHLWWQRVSFNTKLNAHCAASLSETEQRSSCCVCLYFGQTKLKLLKKSENNWPFPIMPLFKTKCLFAPGHEQAHGSYLAIWPPYLSYKEQQKTFQFSAAVWLV